MFIIDNKLIKWSSILIYFTSFIIEFNKKNIYKIEIFIRDNNFFKVEKSDSNFFREVNYGYY